MFEDLIKLLAPFSPVVHGGVAAKAAYDYFTAPEEVESVVAPEPDPEEAEASLSKATDDGSLDYMPTDVLGTREFAPLGQLEAALDPTSEAAARAVNKPIRIHEDVELDAILMDPGHPNYENARNERLLRNRWKKQSPIENLSDPDYLQRHSRQLADQFVAGVPRIPGDIISLAGIVAMAPQALGSDVGKETSEEILKTGAEYYAKVNEIMQVRNPQNPVETLASMGPGAAIPIARGKEIGQGLIKNIAEVATPFTIGGGPGRQAANVATQFVAGEAITAAIQDERDQYETIFESFLSPSDAVAQGADPSLDFQVGSTPDGAPIRNEDRHKFGWLGLGTIAFAVAPSAVRQLAKYWPVDVEPPRVADPTGLYFPETLETPIKRRDVLLTEIADPVKGMTNSAMRAGIDLGDFRANAEMNTSAALQNKIGQSMATGKLETYEGPKYNAKTSVDTVVHNYEVSDDATKAAAKQYADMLHRIDWMKRHNKRSYLGTTSAQARKIADDLARSNPFITALQDGYRRNLEGMINFHSTGEYATLTKSLAKEIEPNFQPRVLDPEFYGSKPLAKDRWKVKGKLPPADKHLSPYETLRMWHEQLMRDRILNSIRGTFIDKVRAQTGDRFIHKLPAGKKQRAAVLGAHPEWGNWVVSFKRRGVEEFYVTNPLWHDVMRFDPNYQRHAMWNTLSRTFQFWTTGHGAPWFAATRFARDTALANQATPPGLKPLGLSVGEIPIPIPGLVHGHALLGIGEQLFRKGQLALAQKLRRAADSPADNWLKGRYGATVLRAKATQLANDFQKSTYHAITGAGGTDVSYARHAIVTANTKIRDFLDSNAPPWAKAIGHMYANILDATQNAGVYTLTARNVRAAAKKKGAPLSQIELENLVAKTKPVTGDVTVAGRSFVREGTKDRLFGVAEKGPLGLISGGKATRSMLEATAWATQAARESVPFSNAVIQSMKSVSMAYWRNPYRFMTKLWLYVGIPQLASYVGAWMIDHANGNNDVQKYMFEGRSEYDKSTKLYIPPIWGGRPEDGIEIPWALEIAPIGYMFMNQLDWMFRHTEDMATPESTMVLKTIANNFFGLTMPPAVGLVGAYYGYEIPGTIPGIGEEPYKAKVNEYNLLPSLSKALTGSPQLGSNLEVAIRTQFGGAANVYLGMANSLMTEGDILDAIKEGAYQFKEKLPVVRQAKRGTFTAINQQNLAHKDKMTQFEKIYDVWIKGEGKFRSSTPGGHVPGRMKLVGVDERPIGMVKQGTLDLTSRPFLNPDEVVQATPFEIDGQIYLVPTVKENLRSQLTKTGRLKKGKDDIKYYKAHNYGVFEDEASAQAYLNKLESAEDEIVTEPMTSLQAQRVFKPDIPAPTNWVYIAAAEKIHEAFQTNGLGFKDYTKNLRDVTEGVHELQRVNSGNLGEFKAHIEQMEDGPVKDMLKDINPTNRNDVQKAINILESRRNPILKQMRRVEREVENELNRLFSELTGQEANIKLMDLGPWDAPPIPEPLIGTGGPSPE